MESVVARYSQGQSQEYQVHGRYVRAKETETSRQEDEEDANDGR